MDKSIFMRFEFFPELTLIQAQIVSKALEENGAKTVLVPMTDEEWSNHGEELGQITNIIASTKDAKTWVKCPVASSVSFAEGLVRITLSDPIVDNLKPE